MLGGSAKESLVTQNETCDQILFKIKEADIGFFVVALITVNDSNFAKLEMSDLRHWPTPLLPECRLDDSDRSHPELDQDLQASSLMLPHTASMAT